VSIVHYSCPPVIGGAEFIIESQARWMNGYSADVEVMVGEGEQFHDDIPVHQVESLGSDYSPAIEATEHYHEDAGERFEEVKDTIKNELRSVLDSSNTWFIHNLLTMPFNLPATVALRELSAETEAQVFPWTHDIAWFDGDYHTPDEYPWSVMGKEANVETYVAISGKRKRQLEEIFDENVPIEVVYDAIEFDEFHELDSTIQALYRDHKMYYDDIIALYPARIVKRKNFELALEIIAALKETGYQLHFIITGPPDPHNPETMEYFDELRELRDDLGLQDEVIFCYEMDNPDGEGRFQVSFNRVRQLYRISDVLIMSSLQEGFGLPLLEAGLTRTVICCSNIDPLPEVGGDAPIYFDPEGDPAHIAGRIEEHLETQDAVLLQRRVRQNFTWPAIFEGHMVPLLNEQYPL
ncbi:MAG: glycosyltransferase family 4 protein, partial [bacterium]